MGASEEDCRLNLVNIISSLIVLRPLLPQQKKLTEVPLMVNLQEPPCLSLLIGHFWNSNIFSGLVSQRPLCNETNFSKNSLYVLQLGVRERAAQIIF